MTNQFAIVQFLRDAKRGSPLLWWSSVAMMFGLAVCFALTLVDARLLAGANVWEKPAKFFLSLTVQAVTMAWAISIVPEKLRGTKTATLLFVIAAWFELAYMIFRASRGEASHFNTGTPLAAFMYAMMGLGSLTLVFTSGFIGWRIWQRRGKILMHEAAGVGLVLGAVLGLIAGGYLSSQTSHWIGGDMTDATGLTYFRWSTTGGDLRVAHFIGLHATQLVPLAALSGNRSVVYGTALIVTLAMFATFIMAAMGVPLLRT
jgi:hypothetical protein